MFYCSRKIAQSNGFSQIPQSTQSDIQYIQNPSNFGHPVDLRSLPIAKKPAGKAAGGRVRCTTIALGSVFLLTDREFDRP
jgi:hypothetical protein